MNLKVARANRASPRRKSRTRRRSRPAAVPSTSEILILPDGRLLAHNLSPALAQALALLNPHDAAMRQRARPAKSLK